MRNTNKTNPVSDERIFIALLKDYELLVEKHTRAEERFLQIISWVIGVLTTITTLILGQSISLIKDISSWVAWSGPFISVFLFYVLVWEFYQLEGYIRRCRVVSEQINHRSTEIILIQFSGNAMVTRFFSSRHGNIKYRWVIRVLMILAALLYILTVVLSLVTVYTHNHLGGFVYSSVIVLLSIVLIYSVSGAIYDLPGYYDKVDIEIENTGVVPKIDSSNVASFGPLTTGLGVLQKIILPRSNLVEKGVMFWYGFIGALAILSVQQSQIDLINFFFQQKTPYTLTPIPWWLVIGLGGIYFFVEEFLLQQAKYLWNDIRDQVWDVKNPSRQDRVFAKGNTVDLSDILHVIIRWTLALVFGYMLGGWQLFLVFMFISIHQAVYVLWGKPRGREHPIILLCIISLNIAPRFMVGVLAVSGTFPLTIPMLMLLAIFHFFSFGFMAAYWKMEAIDFANKKKQGVDVQERPQSEFFFSHGDDLQHQGFLGAIIVSLILLVGYFFSNQNASPAVSCYHVRSVSDLFLCNGLDGKLALTLLTLFILSIHLFSDYSRRVFSWLEKYMTPIMPRIKTGMMLISYTIFFLGLIYVLIEKNKSIYVYFVAILFMNIGAFFMYEGMTWDGLMGLEVKRQIPILIQLWLAYFFAPPETLDNLCLSYSIKPTMGNFLLITMKVLNNETVFLKGQHLPNFI